MKKYIVLLAAACGLFYFQSAQAVCSNPASYSDGNVLTAASLNTNFGAVATCVDDVLNGDIFTGNMSWHNGVDALYYSDTGSTLTASIAADSGNIFLDGTFSLGTGGVVFSDDGDGALTITGAGNGSDENLTLNLDDMANTAVISSSTGVTDLSLHGIGLNVYSDSGSTLKASINKATGASVLGLTQPGQTTNCGISVSGSTFTIAGYDGTALSATNPCVIAIRSNTVGRVALAYFTANITFTFGSASDTDSNLFGITDVNWANTMPMFLGIVYDGTTPYFVISRLPYSVTGAAASALCQKTDTDCDAEIDMMVLTTGLTLASWVNLPVTQVGWFDATYATTGGAWTFAVTNKNGFNKDYINTQFSLPLGQNGAATGTYFLANGGTSAVFTNNNAYYTISESGLCNLAATLEGDGGAEGAGAVTAFFALPYLVSANPTSSGSYNRYPIGEVHFTNTSLSQFGGVEAVSSTYQAQFVRNSSTTAVSTLLQSDFTTTRALSFSATYRTGLY